MKDRQLTLWDNPSLDVTSRVKSAMRDALSGCPLSREVVAERMSDIARREGMCGKDRSPVSPDMLDKWVASSASAHRVPYPFLTIFCSVTDSLLPIDAMLAPLNARAVSGEDWDLLELAKIEAQQEELSRRAKAIKAKIRVKK